MDIMFPLGTGSNWQDNELKYALRSIEKHLTGVDNIYIIGTVPSWVKGVKCIPFEDVGGCKETNIYNKIVRACNEPGISEDFLFFNDDHFLLKDCIASEFPFYCKGDLLTVVQAMNPRNRYARCVNRTMRTLHSLGLSTKNFDTHTPIIYNKSKFLESMSKYDWTPRFTFVVKSLYANTLGIDGIKEPDCKITRPMVAEDIFNMIADRVVFSIGNNSLCDQLTIALDTLYPNKSKYEI